MDPDLSQIVYGVVDAKEPSHIWNPNKKKIDHFEAIIFNNIVYYILYDFNGFYL